MLKRFLCVLLAFTFIALVACEPEHECESVSAPKHESESNSVSKDRFETEPESEHECEVVSEEEFIDDSPVYKPVIYLYPEAETDLEVKLDYAGKLTCVYPEYNNGWSVTAFPDGTLKDKNGMQYNYLYWEGIGGINPDFSEGFCVAGGDTASFLEDALFKLGLTRREANEFIVFWLPKMQENKYNLISFQFENYTKSAKLTVTPAPDTVIRVFMAWKALDEQVEIQPQTLVSPERKGFTLVEWGGTQAG